MAEDTMYIPEGQLKDRPPAEQIGTKDTQVSGIPEDRTGETKELRSWRSKIANARKVKSEWEKKYQIKDLENWYLGHQRNFEEMAKDTPVVNQIWSTVESILPSVLYYNPKFGVRPKPGRADDPGSSVDGADLASRCQLREDMINNIYNDPEYASREACDLSLKESMFAFGVTIIGYSADFNENPNKDKPVLDDKNEPTLDSQGQPIIDTRGRVIVQEDVFVKRIPWQDWYISSSNKNRTVENDWVGYTEKVYVSDLRKDPYYDQVAAQRAKADSNLIDDKDKPSTPEDNSDSETVTKWTIYDFRTRSLLQFVEQGDLYLKREELKMFNVADLRHHSILNSWYPCPPVWQLLECQKELNDIKKKIKNQRRLTNRMVKSMEGVMDEDEEAKLEMGEDGQVIKVKRMDAFDVIEFPQPDRSVYLSYPLAKDDFREVSGIGGEQKGVAGAETATQAQIIDVNSKVRSSYRREMVARWLGHIGWLIGKTAEDNMTLDMWILRNVDLQSPAAMMEAARVAANWQKITFNDLKDMNYEVQVDVEALSPVTMEQQRAEWFEVLNIISNPAIMMFLLTSDEVLKKTLAFLGMRADKDVQMIKQGMIQILTMQLTMGAGPDGGKGAGPAKKPDNSGGTNPQPKPQGRAQEAVEQGSKS
jgi:hypothetical protein